MRGARNLSPVDTPKLHEGCHCVNHQICVFVNKIYDLADPAIPQTRRTLRVRLHSCCFSDLSAAALRRRETPLKSVEEEDQTTLSVVLYRGAFLSLLEAAPVDAEVA